MSLKYISQIGILYFLLLNIYTFYSILKHHTLTPSPTPTTTIISLPKRTKTSSQEKEMNIEEGNIEEEKVLKIFIYPLPKKFNHEILEIFSTTFEDDDELGGCIEGYINEEMYYYQYFTSLPYDSTTSTFNENDSDDSDYGSGYKAIITSNPEIAELYYIPFFTSLAKLFSESLPNSNTKFYTKLNTNFNNMLYERYKVDLLHELLKEILEGYQGGMYYKRRQGRDHFFIQTYSNVYSFYNEQNQETVFRKSLVLGSEFFSKHFQELDISTILIPSFLQTTGATTSEKNDISDISDISYSADGSDSSESFDNEKCILGIYLKSNNRHSLSERHQKLFNTLPSYTEQFPFIQHSKIYTSTSTSFPITTTSNTSSSSSSITSTIASSKFCVIPEYRNIATLPKEFYYALLYECIPVFLLPLNTHSDTDTNAEQLQKKQKQRHNEGLKEKQWKELGEQWKFPFRNIVEYENFVIYYHFKYNTSTTNTDYNNNNSNTNIEEEIHNLESYLNQITTIEISQKLKELKKYKKYLLHHNFYDNSGDGNDVESEVMDHIIEKMKKYAEYIRGVY